MSDHRRRLGRDELSLNGDAATDDTQLVAIVEQVITARLVAELNLQEPSVTDSSSDTT